MRICVYIPQQMSGKVTVHVMPKMNKLNRYTDEQVYLCTCRAVETLTGRSKRLIGMTV